MNAEPPRAKVLFRMVPDELRRHPSVDGTDIMVWCALCYLGRPKWLTDATDDAIAREARVGARSVRRTLLKLEQIGFLERTTGERGRRIVLRPEGAGEPGPKLHVVS